jgi:hypothetical protein
MGLGIRWPTRWGGQLDGGLRYIFHDEINRITGVGDTKGGSRMVEEPREEVVGRLEEGSTAGKDAREACRDVEKGAVREKKKGL